jgi:hypothetical protein
MSCTVRATYCAIPPHLLLLSVRPKVSRIPFLCFFISFFALRVFLLPLFLPLMLNDTCCANGKTNGHLLPVVVFILYTYLDFCNK